MDELDYKIIEELQKDSRQPFRSIAKKLGVRTQTVIGRYNKLKKNGIIMACTISINTNKIGYEGLASLLISSHNKKSTTSTQDQLLSIDDVFLITKTIGDFDTFAVIAYRNSKDLYQKVQKIKKLANIEKVEASFTTPALEIPYPLNKSNLE